MKTYFLYKALNSTIFCQYHNMAISETNYKDKFADYYE